MLKINDVCKKYKVTSRALRFWESEGLINSIHENTNAPRYYTDVEIERINKIIFLKKLNLPLKQINELLSDKSNIALSLKEHRSYLCSQMNDIRCKFELLQHVIACIDNGRDIFQTEIFHENTCTERDMQTVKQCVEYILNNNFAELTKHFSSSLKVRLLPNQVKAVWVEHITSIGNFVSVVKYEAITDNIIAYLAFEKCYVTLKFIFTDSLISGLWLNYYNKEQKQ